MVSLVKNTKSRRPIRRRDFATTSYEAPLVTKRLSRAYQKNHQKSWRFWLVMCSIFLFSGLIIGFLYAPIFSIKNIIINNVVFKPTEERLNQILNDYMKTSRWYIFPQKNLIFFSPSEARKILSSEFYIEEVVFKKHWPNVLKINVAKNVIVGVFKSENSSFLLDRRGLLVQQVNNTLENDKRLPVIVEKNGSARSLGEAVLEINLVQFIDDLYELWNISWPEMPFLYITVEKNSLPTMQINMPEGWYVNVTGESSAVDQVNNLKRLLEERIKDDKSKLQYIDVRFGNRLYFKLK